MDDFTLRFDVDSLNELDDRALLACQSYNLGNASDWFGCFRGGLYGAYARLHGIMYHYEALHSWSFFPHLPTTDEFHLASVFFNMDSVLECLTFALNAFGYASKPGDFHDITSEHGLKKIAPKDILGGKSQPLSGYGIVFPKLQAYWQSNVDLIELVTEQHDVSKHRQTIFKGGMKRLDAPPSFFGADANAAIKVGLAPMAEIILGNELKKPRPSRTRQSPDKFVYLENVVEEFCDFVKQTSDVALEEASANIPLPYSTFQR